MLVTYFLIMTQFWPWYMIWALALGALKPADLPVRFAILLSASVLSLYLTLGYAHQESRWLFPCRSILAIVLPSLLFLVVTFRVVPRERDSLN